MGLFTKPNRPTLTLGFVSPSEVCVVSDTATSTNADPPGYLLFPFLFAGKLYFNFPPGRVRAVAAHAKDQISSQFDESADFPNNFSLLGTCSSTGLAWVATTPSPRWLYRCEFVDAASGPVPQTHFTRGNDEALHAAAIDACFDYARQKAGDRGGAVCLAAMGIHMGMAQHGGDDPRRPIQFAHVWARKAAGMIRTGKME